MRRPDPLPQRPRIEQTDNPVAASAPRGEPEHDDVYADATLPGYGEAFDSSPSAFSDERDHAESAARAGERDGVADDSVVADGDDNETAVITPLRPPLTGAPASAEQLDVDEGTTTGDAPEAGAAPPVGWRDVWRAARAKRKALRREVRRFTGRARRRRLIWIVSLSALATVVLGSFAVAYSPLFAVQKITVTGTTSLDPAAVTAALSDHIGTPLALVNESDIKAALVTFPAVETYTIQARPPHELVVAIVERTPVGVVETDAGYSLVDAAGVVLSTTPEQPAGYPIFEVAGALGESTFRSAGMVMLSIPDSIRGSVAKVTATTPADVTLTLSPTGTQVIWGNADDSQIKSQVLEKAMLTRPVDTVSVYDVSSPTAIVMR